MAPGLAAFGLSQPLGLSPWALGLYNFPMSILKVARMGHPVLRAPAKALDRSSLRQPLLQKLIDDMIDTMFEYHGVGLAAPQVHEGVRLFVGLLDEEPGPESDPVTLINPEIVPQGTATE